MVQNQVINNLDPAQNWKCKISVWTDCLLNPHEPKKKNIGFLSNFSYFLTFTRAIQIIYCVLYSDYQSIVSYIQIISLLCPVRELNNSSSESDLGELM